MSLWYSKQPLELGPKQLGGAALAMGIKLHQQDADSLTMWMEVNEKTHQPMGVLHGGVTCLLAETCGSIASNLCLDPKRNYAVGMYLNASHLRPVREGKIYARSHPVHLGKKTHVWQISVTDQAERTVAQVTFGTAVLEAQDQ